MHDERNQNNNSSNNTNLISELNEIKYPNITDLTN